MIFVSLINIILFFYDWRTPLSIVDCKNSLIEHLYAFDRRHIHLHDLTTYAYFDTSIDIYFQPL